MSEISLDLTFSNKSRNHNKFKLWSFLPPFPDHLVTLTISIGLLMVVTMPDANINVFNVVIPPISNLYLSNLRSGSTRKCTTSMPRVCLWWWTSWLFWHRRRMRWEPYWRMLKNMWYVHFSLFKKFFMPHFYSLPLLLAIMSSLAFTKTFGFLPFPSIINSVITPSSDNFYPPPILTKHHTWYLLNTNIFISIYGILYRIHQQQVKDSLLFQEVLWFGQDHWIGTIPFHPIPFNNLEKKIFDWLVVLLYCGTTPLNHLSRND
jgi:hypothetical protein